MREERWEDYKLIALHPDFDVTPNTIRYKEELDKMSKRLSLLLNRDISFFSTADGCLNVIIHD